jgi:two-component system, NtrC family, response regulator HydG
MPHRLLIVDDEASILFAMREYFSALGYEVDCASGLDDAMTLMRTSRHDAVIADLRLGPIHTAEGLEIVRFIRARSPTTRILLLTAYGSPEIEKEGQRCGVDFFLQKPKPLPEVAGIVARLLAQ